MANDITTFRREQIKSALREEYRQLCSADIAPRRMAFWRRFAQTPAANKLNSTQLKLTQREKTVMATQIANITPQRSSIVRKIRALLFYGKANKSQKPKQMDELPSREKLLKLLEETKQSVSTFEEHLPNIKSQLKNECDNFRAARIAQFYENWREFTHDQEILRYICGPNIEFNTTPQQHKLSYKHKQFSEDDTMTIEFKVEKLLPNLHNMNKEKSSQTYSLGLKQMAHTG